MAAVYSNKFTVEVNDVARIVLVDERMPPAKGLPMASVTASEVVLTRGNFLALSDELARIAAQMRKDELRG